MTPAIRMKALRFPSFMALCAVFGLAIGFSFGVFSFVAALLGAEVTAELFFVTIEGTTAGFVNLFWGPVLVGILSPLFGLLAYFPFRWILGAFSGLPLRGEFELDDGSRV